MKASRNAERGLSQTRISSRSIGGSVLYFLVPLLIAVSVTACGEAEDHGINILDSGVFGFDTEETYWIDDHRVLFVGWIGDKPKTRKKGERQISEHLLVWDTNSNEISVYRENAWSLCYFDGFVSYLTSESGWEGDAERYLMTGALGEEKVTEPKPITRENKWFRRKSDIDCKVWDAPGFLGKTDWKPLIRAHGLIDRGRWPGDKRRRARAFFRSLDGNTNQQLPMSANLINRVHYYAFNGKYLVQPRTAGFQSSHVDVDCWPYWWMSTDGVTVTDCLPYGAWSGKGSMWVIGTTAGAVAISHKIASAHGVGNAGAYLVQEEGYVKLAGGLVWSPSISSDGCRLAFLHSPGPMPRDRDTDYWVSLKSIDVCALA